MEATPFVEFFREHPWRGDGLVALIHRNAPRTPASRKLDDVEDAIRSDFIRAVVLGDFLADEHDVRVAFDFLGKGLVEGFAVFDEWELISPGSPE